MNCLLRGSLANEQKLKSKGSKWNYNVLEGEKCGMISVIVTTAAAECKT